MTRYRSRIDHGVNQIEQAAVINIVMVANSRMGRITARPGTPAARIPVISPSDDIAVLRDDLRRAEEYGVDLSMLRAGLQITPLQRLEDNDAALEFFASITVIPAR